MQTNSSPKISRAARDPYLFIGFVTLIIVAIYILTLVNTQSVRGPVKFVIFTGLNIVHTFLHWQLGRIINDPRRTTWYILIQGALACLILLFTNNLYMIIALYMILLGEAVGLFGMIRESLFAAVYYSALMTVNLVYLFGWAESGEILLNIIPIAVFVVLSVTFYMRQSEARAQAQSLAAELESANQQLAEYAGRVEEFTLAAERQRVARELHDTLSQGLAGLVLQLEAIKAHLESGREKRAAAIIDQSLARARSTLADSRAVIDDLRAIPDSPVEAVRAKTERFTQITGIPCELKLALGDTAISSDTGEHLLNIIKEALANVTRHAQAGKVWIRLEARNNHLELEIQDDGQGFDPGTATGTGHYGLLGMRERARLVGGTLEIESGNGLGTCIRFVAPLPEET